MKISKAEQAKRKALLTALATMPDEAFGWFVVWASGGMMQFPDGLGGFQQDSRDSIVALRREAARYMDPPQKGPTPS